MDIWRQSRLDGHQCVGPRQLQAGLFYPYGLINVGQEGVDIIQVCALLDQLGGTLERD